MNIKKILQVVLLFSMNVFYSHAYASVEEDIDKSFSSETGSSFEEHCAITKNFNQSDEKNLSTINQQEISNDANQQYHEGLKYLEGEGVLQNEGEGFKYIKAAADQGHMEAQYDVALLLLRAENKKEYFKYLKLAADQGHRDAQCYLGLEYLNEEGLENKDEDLRYLKLAANQGDTEAQGILASYSRTKAEVIELRKIFKVGFEFQTGSSKCPWAKGIEELKTNPIFTIKKGERTLWDLTIDWVDLEFITSPFSNTEKNLLRECLESIELSLNVLKKFNDTNKLSVTFSDWINGRTTETDFVLENSEFEIPEDQEIEGLSSILRKRGLTLDILNPAYLFEKIEMPNSWSPVLTPQVTIQHKLELNTALMMSLSCSKESLTKEDKCYLLKDYRLKGYLAEENPVKQRPRDVLFLETIKSFSTDKEQFFTFSEEGIIIPKRIDPINSFLVFFVYSCRSMARFEKRGDEKAMDDHINSKLTDGFKNTGQVNAKLKTTFLWRRPFSEVYKNIDSNKNIRKFRDIYSEFISPEFNQKMSAIFKYISYGEYYYDASKNIMDLTWLNEYVNKISEEEMEFLKNGVVYLSSIRKMNSLVTIRCKNNEKLEKPIMDIFSNYFEDLIDSISDVSLRYDFEPENLCIRQREHPYDLLSPPYFLAQTDSMGAYKKQNLIDLEYGEVIIEFRELRHIGTYALQQMGLTDPDIEDNFLTKKLGAEICQQLTLTDQVGKLFDFLEDELTN